MNSREYERARVSRGFRVKWYLKSKWEGMNDVCRASRIEGNARKMYVMYVLFY